MARAERRQSIPLTACHGGSMGSMVSISKGGGGGRGRWRARKINNSLMSLSHHPSRGYPPGSLSPLQFLQKDDPFAIRSIKAVLFQTEQHSGQTPSAKRISKSGRSSPQISLSLLSLLQISPRPMRRTKTDFYRRSLRTQSFHGLNGLSHRDSPAVGLEAL